MKEALLLAWYLVPGFCANIMPVFAAKLFPNWKTPIDFGLRLKGKPLLGENKTWRGLVFGVLTSLAISYLQSRFSKSYPSPWWAWGFLIGFGALAADALKSFFKRRIGIPPGKPWIPFDQIDHALGSIGFGAFLYWQGWNSSVLVLIGTFFGHILINLIGFYTGLRKEPF